jgi:hypothetical protein
MFHAPDSFSSVTRASGIVFMFCTLGLIFGGTEGVASHFLILRSRTPFRRYRVCRVPFSCFALPDPFWAIPIVLGPVFMFCAPGLILGAIEGDVSRTFFRLNRGCRVSFSSFALPDSFPPVLWASGPVFMFYAPIFIFNGIEGVGSHFYFLRSRTHFGWNRGRRAQFSCFTPLDSFSAVPWASGLVFMICDSGLIFGSTEGVGSHFQVLHSRTHFGRNRERRVQFSCFALPKLFSAVPRASGPIFIFCSSRLVFIFCSSRLIFDSTRVGSENVLHFQTHFGRYRGRRVQFSSFAFPNSF